MVSVLPPLDEFFQNLLTSFNLLENNVEIINDTARGTITRCTSFSSSFRSNDGSYISLPARKSPCRRSVRRSASTGRIQRVGVKRFSRRISRINREPDILPVDRWEPEPSSCSSNQSSSNKSQKIRHHNKEKDIFPPHLPKRDTGRYEIHVSENRGRCNQVSMPDARGANASNTQLRIQIRGANTRKNDFSSDGYKHLQSDTKLVMPRRRGSLEIFGYENSNYNIDQCSKGKMEAKISVIDLSSRNRLRNNHRKIPDRSCSLQYEFDYLMVQKPPSNMTVEHVKDADIIQMHGKKGS